FLGASAGLLSAELFAAAPPILHPGKEMADAPFRPDMLFLTWQRDPTTTMTVQWVGTRGETSDNRIYYAKSSGGLWQAKATEARPYAATDFKVFRSELTGLSPATDYQFRVGKESPTYRFRTMPARLSDSFSFVSGGDCGINPHAVANNI